MTNDHLAKTLSPHYPLQLGKFEYPAVIPQRTAKPCINQ